MIMTINNAMAARLSVPAEDTRSQGPSVRKHVSKCGTTNYCRDINFHDISSIFTMVSIKILN